MATLAGLGAGWYILAIIWILSIFLFIVLARAQGALAVTGVGIIAAAVIITVILWVIPRGTEAQVDPYVVYDAYYVGRTALISCCGIALGIGLMLLVPCYIFELYKAQPILNPK